MKRRDFLRLIGVASIAPSVLATIPKENPVMKVIDWKRSLVLVSPGIGSPDFKALPFCSGDFWYSTDLENLLVYDDDNFIKVY